MRNILLASAALLALQACGPKETPVANTETAATEQTVSQTEQLNAWFDEKYEEQLLRSPQTLTQLGRHERYDEVDDNTEAFQLEGLEWLRETTAEMRETFDFDQLDEEAQFSYRLWEARLERAELGWQWRHYGYAFTQGGWHTYPARFLINFHNVNSDADMEAYISRIEGFANALDVRLARAQTSAEMGIRAPSFAYRGALETAQNIVRGAPFTDGEDSPIYADVKTKIAALVESGEIDEARAEELEAEAVAALTGPFLNSYNELISWLETDMENTEESFGVSELPNGEAYYNYRLASYTTTDLTADEIHEIGLAEVERLRGEMELIKEEVGFDGSLQEFFDYLRVNTDDPELFLPNTDEGRQAYIDEATRQINNIREQLPDYFGILPQADVVVRRVEAFRERAGAAQHYVTGTPDGSRPGVYYAHLLDMSALPLRELEVVAYHEAIPGHHMQRSIAQELTGIPQFRTRQSNSAYTEGWALYSELLANEMPGTYQDPLSQFGRLGTEIWRAIRLVVDTGLHTKGWTREDSIAYFLENSAITEAQAASETERYIVGPGQATSYKIGMIRILELRAHAEEVLGEDFDIRGFHDTILGGGSLPLDLLEVRVNNWIEDVQNS
ncbi:DUF885 family protein [Ponticaulis sp.]|uniref:DUF885 domain-containing protein n=1 Tax=Ponticaulis sp. TaxID=2020902 RepID=UPI000C5994CF|nr:DUF885 domain-containing protein [Ponticaulis sp.]MBN05645.1 DUF885 domain-containing protein [Ponticaulis sp.]